MCPCLKFILVYVLSVGKVAKVAKVAEFSEIEGVVRCLIYVCTWLIGRQSSKSSILYGGVGVCSLTDIYVCIYFVGSKNSRSSRVFGGTGTRSMSDLCLQCAFL